MRKAIILGLALLTAAGVSIGVAWSGYSAGSALSVKSLRATLMVNKEFFGPKVKTLRRGARVKVVRKKGSWLYVSHEGTNGWLHKNRVTSKTIKLTSGTTGGGATRGEAELAGRGFNPKIEGQFREKHRNLDYSHIDKIQKVDIDPAAVAKFARSGGIKAKAGGK